MSTKRKGTIKGWNIRELAKSLGARVIDNSTSTDDTEKIIREMLHS